MQTLTAHNVTITFSQKKICDGLNLQIKTGEFWGILGPNGCGKTSLLHALCGLQPISSGAVFLCDKNLKDYSRRKIAQNIGVLFQQENLSLPQTVREYCLQSNFPHRDYFSRLTQAEINHVDRILSQFDLIHYANKTISQLSGGEKQRVKIASLLVQCPQFYLLDEPINHLDVKYQYQILNHFKTLAHQENKSIVAVFHDVNIAQRFCDHALLLFKDGTIKQGITSEIFSTSNLSLLYEYQLQAFKTASTTIWAPC